MIANLIPILSLLFLINSHFVIVQSHELPQLAPDPRCMILVKCGVPYACVADAKWSPEDAEVRSIVDHQLGPWTPIPLAPSP